MIVGFEDSLGMLLAHLQQYITRASVYINPEVSND